MEEGINLVHDVPSRGFRGSQQHMEPGKCYLGAVKKRGGDTDGVKRCCDHCSVGAGRYTLRHSKQTWLNAELGFLYK